MSHLIEVAFKGNRKEFFLWEADELPSLKAAIIVEADRGEDLGRVHAIGELAAKRSAGVPHGLGAEGAAPARKALRLATADDATRASELAEQNESARRRAMERVKANGLVMKLTDAEWQWDRKKLTFYFTAEKRVDFRNLVRDLASMFRTRIELKQIGVRDEARRLDGIGRCGRQYCSSSWLPELRPVNLGVAKDQRLSLNPTQISGACGRLMCSLRYEHEFYVQSRKRFPKEGKILVTSLGEEKVVANDIFHDRVTLRRPDGDARVVALADLKREVAAAAEAAGDAGALAAADAMTQGADDEAAPSIAGREGADEGDATAAEERDAASSPPPAGDRRHEVRPESRRPPRGGTERRPTRGSERAENGAGTAAEGAVDPPPTPRAPASPASGSPGAWVRQRAPLPQLTDPRGAAPPPLVPAPAPSVSAPSVSAPSVSAPAAAIPTAAAIPAPPPGDAGDTTVASTDADEAAATPAAVPGDESAGEQQRRARRRRGRRGGRRGRGGGGGGAGGESDRSPNGVGDGDAGDGEAGDDNGGDDGDAGTTDHGE